MGQIQIKYDEVNSKSTELKRRISSEILSGVERDYHQIQSMLNRVDGATAAKLREAMDTNKQKTIKAANNLNKLLSFMANSSKQVELNEQKMVKDIKSSARSGR